VEDQRPVASPAAQRLDDLRPGALCQGLLRKEVVVGRKLDFDPPVPASPRWIEKLVASTGRRADVAGQEGLSIMEPVPPQVVKQEVASDMSVFPQSLGTRMARRQQQ
jgi:hypothetical protein